MEGFPLFGRTGGVGEKWDIKCLLLFKQDFQECCMYMGRSGGFEDQVRSRQPARPALTGHKGKNSSPHILCVT